MHDFSSRRKVVPFFRTPGIYEGHWLSRMLVTALHTLRGWTRDVKFYDCVYKELP